MALTFASVLLRNSTGGGAAFAPPALAFARITRPIYERVFFYPAKVTWRFARVKFSGANINKRVVDPTSTVETVEYDEHHRKRLLQPKKETIFGN